MSDGYPKHFKIKGRTAVQTVRSAEEERKMRKSYPVEYEEVNDETVREIAAEKERITEGIYGKAADPRRK